MWDVRKALPVTMRRMITGGNLPLSAPTGSGDEFLTALYHIGTPLHLQDITLLRHHFIQYRIDKKSQE
jgi:hypothetical protein